MIRFELSQKVSTDIYQKIQSAWREITQNSQPGFLNLADNSILWQECELHANQVRAQFKHFAVIGIGGSSLGLRSIVTALSHGLGDSRIHFFENPDPLSFQARMQSFTNLKEVHWIIISKSGQTMETLAIANQVQQYLNQKQISFSAAATVITENCENPLFDWATQNKIKILEIQKNISGRFSVLSAVGMFPAACLGYSLENFRRGASWALQQGPMVTQLAGASLESWERSEWLTLFWLYSDAFKDLGLWMQQLWSESLAKKVNRNNTSASRVSTPISLVGSNDQHSIFQQVIEGARDKWVWFVRSEQHEKAGDILTENTFAGHEYLQSHSLGTLLKTEAEATEQALKKVGIHTLQLSLEKVDEFHLGAYFMLMQLVVATLGEYLQINTYDQPGVELGKSLARQTLQNLR